MRLWMIELLRDDGQWKPLVGAMFTRKHARSELKLIKKRQFPPQNSRIQLRIAQYIRISP